MYSKNIFYYNSHSQHGITKVIVKLTQSGELPCHESIGYSIRAKWVALKALSKNNIMLELEQK